MFKQANYQKYLDILQEELVPALGCTEPIAVAYGAALAKKYLKGDVKLLSIKASGNIIKNAKSVVVPNTSGLKGMQASLLAGLVGGNPDLKLEVLANITPADIKKINSLMNTGLTKIEQLNTPSSLHMIIMAQNDEHDVVVEIKDLHTNVVRITVDGQNLDLQETSTKHKDNQMTDRTILSIDQILDFVEEAKLADYKTLLDLQVKDNMDIAKEGLTNEWGINVGKSIIEAGNNTLDSKIKGYSAAGSDARMNGCTMPVVTNSGSGNQGLACSVPVIVYAEENKIEYEKMMKALLLSNLVTIHIKAGITRLSCYCGAVVAASGGAAGITYLEEGTSQQIKMAITNVLGNISGVVCDGAKESCPAKIASGIDAALQAVNLALHDRVYSHGCGIVEDEIEQTIKNVVILAKSGMEETDKVILDIMTSISN